ncbi:MAG: hypothetical protein K2Y32_18185 [Candidatus Obscuribacterales bacterium]|nr:hypothetical protein [Candidatus Obscuribacterales bacterium]
MSNFGAVRTLAQKSLGVVALLSLITFCNPRAVHSQGAVFKQIQSGQFKAAYPQIKAMAQANPREMSYQYYLGICAKGTGDKATAELALTKVVAGTVASSPYSVNAVQALSQLNPTLKPYSCAPDGKTRRWSPKAMPLKVFIADGLGLNTNLAGRDLASTEMVQVINFLHSNSLKQIPGYRPHFKRAIADAMQVFDWAIKSKLVNFALVGSAKSADAVVLFCEQTQEGVNGVTVYPLEKGQPCLIQIALSPVNGLPDPEAFRLVKQAAAVQIGHLIGLGRSQNQGDLMFESTQLPGGRGAERPSPNDLAMLRAIYSMPCDILIK